MQGLPPALNLNIAKLRWTPQFKVQTSYPLYKLLLQVKRSSCFWRSEIFVVSQQLITEPTPEQCRCPSCLSPRSKGEPELESRVGPPERQTAASELRIRRQDGPRWWQNQLCLCSRAARSHMTESSAAFLCAEHSHMLNIMAASTRGCVVSFMRNLSRWLQKASGYLIIPGTRTVSLMCFNHVSSNQDPGWPWSWPGWKCHAQEGL